MWLRKIRVFSSEPPHPTLSPKRDREAAFMYLRSGHPRYARATWFGNLGAAVALGKIRNQPSVVVPALLQYFESAKGSSNISECEVALNALARQSPNVQAAVPLLVALLHDPDLRLRDGVR